MGSTQYMETVKSFVDTEKPNFETKLLNTICFEGLPKSDYDLEEYLKGYLKKIILAKSVDKPEIICYNIINE